MNERQLELQAMEVQVRPGTSKDADAAGHLFQAHLNWINVWYEPDEVVQRKSSVRRIKTCIRDGYPSAIAIFDDVTAGFAISELRDPHVLEILNVYVDDPYRKKGYGSQLLESISQQAVEMGVHTLMACASAYYFPDKKLPDGLFRRQGFQVHDLAPGTHMYVKRLVEIEAEKTPKIRRIRMTSTGELSDE